MQVLLIENIHTKWELNIENAKLEYSQAPPVANIENNSGELQIETKSGKLEYDTYEARQSLGFNNSEDLISSASQKGKDSIRQYTRQAVETGAQLARIEDGVSIGQIVKNKMQEMDGTYTAFMPSGGVQMQWIPNQITTQFEPGEIQFDWDIQETEFDFSPGSVHFQILQYPNVNIEYVGDPLYVPPSSDPKAQEK